MPRRSMNIYFRDGYPARVVADDPSLRDVEINVIINDTPDRLLFASMVAEAEIERYCADQRACRAHTQWHGLAIASECVGECLMAMRDQHYGDPAAMNAAIEDILTRFSAARSQAMDVNAAAEGGKDAARPRYDAETPPPRKGNGKQSNQRTAVN